ncbi:glypican-5-like [Oratosquilla oratoria]|uniref:glypican-5-like n=1 Tax=Oratosquilla oratoria TaxID=337810 RepID=UPI003F772C9B
MFPHPDAAIECLTFDVCIFAETVEAALTVSETRTHEAFRSAYPHLSASHVIRDLYSALRASLTDSDDLGLERALDTFWDDLFPLVYHSALQPRLPPFSRHFASCLRFSRRDVRPWSTVPELVGGPLLRGLETARLLIQGLDVGAEIVRDAQDIMVPAECGEAAARLSYCGACHSAVAPPCPAFCLNVARGCLAPLAEVDGAWGELVTAISRVDQSLRAARLSHILNTLHDRLAEAVMVALESGPTLERKVHKECGHPQREGSNHTHENHHSHNHNHNHNHNHHNQKGTFEEDTNSMAFRAEEDKDSKTSLVFSALDNTSAIRRALEASRGWWTGLPDTFCVDVTENDASAGATNIATSTGEVEPEVCWNGVKVAKYTKTVAGHGVSAQKYNPEVRIGRPDTRVYSMADTLHGFKRDVTSKLSWMPEAQSQHAYEYTNVQGSGSGISGRDDYPYGGNYYEDSPNDDDEDSMAELGSGIEGSGESTVIPDKAAPPLAEQASSTTVVTQDVFMVLASVLTLLLHLSFH